MKLYPLIFTLFGMLPLVQAEQKALLEEVTVTARPIGLQSIEHIAQPVSVLNNQALATRQASTVGETLSNIAGVTTNRFTPLASRPVIRGLGGARVLVLQNGIGSMDVSTISVDHPVTIDPIQARQIEIFRGPATLLYGSEAAGGLVNVVNNRIPSYVPDFKPTLYSSYNSNSLEKLVSFQAEGGYEKLAFHLDGTKRDAKDYESKNGRISNSFYDSENYNFGTAFIDSWGSVGLAYGRFNSTHGIPVNPEEPEEQPFLVSQQDRIDGSAQLLNPIQGISAVNIQVGYNDYTHTEFENVAELGTVFDNEQFDSRVEIQHTPFGNFNGAVGLQLGYRNVSAVGEEAFLPKTTTERVAFFVLEETDINDVLHFEVGGRFEKVKHDPDNIRAISQDLYSISTGLHWHFFENTGLSLNIGRSQRAVAAEELFANGPHIATGTFELGQTNLEEETSNNIDLSLRHEVGRLQWNISLFTNYIENFVFLQSLDLNNDGMVDRVDADRNPGGELQLVQYQQDDAVFYGFEAMTNVSLYAKNDHQLDLNLFADYVRAERTNGEGLPRISPPRIGFGLNYNYRQLTAGLSLTNHFAQKDNAVLETDTDGYSVLSLNVNQTLIKGTQSLDIFARATNLLDEDGRLHTSFIKDRAPIMGRALTVGLKASF